MIFVFFDTTQGIAMAAIRASGKQKIGSLITSFAYVLIGIPLALVGVFSFDWGIRGIWVGPTVAVIITTCSYLGIFYCLDWKKLIEESEKKRN